MFASELKKLIDDGCNYHLTWHRASGEGMTVPPEMKILVPYFSEEGSFYGYGEAYAYYEPDLGAFIIEQRPKMILEQ